MKQYKIAGAVLLIVPIFLLAALTAWAGPKPDIEPASTPSTSTEAIAPADAMNSVQAAEATGLDIVMDGSSLEAYEKSLEKVKATGSEDDYEKLKSAFEYLLLYDLGARRNREKLAARLDGKTGNEIVNRVKWHKP